LLRGSQSGNGLAQKVDHLSCRQKHNLGACWVVQCDWHIDLDLAVTQDGL